MVKQNKRKGFTLIEVVTTVFIIGLLVLLVLPNVALMSRLWTGFFGTESCRTPKNFQNPDFSLKWRDFWVFFVGGIGASPAGERKQVV